MCTYLADLGQDLANPIDTCEETAKYRLVRTLTFKSSAPTRSTKTAEQGCVNELGVRSIINTIGRNVRMPLVERYLAAKDGIA